MVKCSDLSLYLPWALLTPIGFPSRKCSDVLNKLGGRGLPRVVPLASHMRSGGRGRPGCWGEPAWDMHVLPWEPWHPALHPEPLTSPVCACGPLTKGKLHATPLHLELGPWTSGGILGWQHFWRPSKTPEEQQPCLLTARPSPFDLKMSAQTSAAILSGVTASEN